MERKGKLKFLGVRKILLLRTMRVGMAAPVSGVECEDSVAVCLMDAVLTAETAPLTSVCVRKLLQPGSGGARL